MLGSAHGSRPSGTQEAYGLPGPSSKMTPRDALSGRRRRLLRVLLLAVLPLGDVPVDLG